MNVRPEIMYDKSSFLIAIFLFIGMLIINQIAYELGRRNEHVENPEMKAQSTAIQTGIIGLLALLLGFTFNMSLQRYDARSYAVIEESGVIGRVSMQANLLSENNRDAILAELDRYLQLRIELSSVDLSDPVARKKLNSDVSSSQLSLVTLAEKEMLETNRPVTANALYQAIAGLIQIENKRAAMLRLHVPEPVLFLLFGVFITAGGMLGYTSGLGKRRPAFPTVLMFTIIVLVVFIIIDLDRPKRGIIQVNQESLIDTQMQLRSYMELAE